MDISGNNCSQKEYHLCECVNKIYLADDIYSLEFLWNGPVPLSGQFFLVRPRGTSVFLGRPLGAAGWRFNGTGGGLILRFIFAVRGRGTIELAEIKPGEKAHLGGPLGRGWAEISGAWFGKTFDDGKRFPNKIALVAGGVGIAPLALFSSELGKQNHNFYAGFKNEFFGLEGLKPDSLVMSGETGTFCNKGFITGFFSPDSYGAVFSCGPEPMMKAVAEKCKAAGVPCFVSLERRMACGVGACLGCTVKTKNGNKRCCADGPVFNAEDVFFE